MKKIKNLLCVTMAIMGLSLLSTVPALAQVDTNKSACEGLALAGVKDCGDKTAAETTAKGLIASIINIISVAGGVVAVIMIIIGGFRYVVSNGDSNGVSGAKNTILYAIVGLVVILFAQVIVRFVLTTATSPTQDSSTLQDVGESASETINDATNQE